MHSDRGMYFVLWILSPVTQGIVVFCLRFMIFQAAGTALGRLPPSVLMCLPYSPLKAASVFTCRYLAAGGGGGGRQKENKT